MKNKILKTLLAISIMANVGGYTYYDMKSFDYQSEIKHHNITISHLQDNVKTKSDQIANLDSVVKLKNENVLKQQKTIDSDIKTINELELKAKQLQDENNKLKAENFKKRMKGSDVGVVKPSPPKAQPKPQAPKVQVKTPQAPPQSNHRVVNVTATAYIAHCSEGCTGRTTTGVNVSNSIYYNGYRVIAVDTHLIPLNSLVKVETATQSFTAMAIDTGGGIVGNRIDVLVGDTKTALQFGKEQVKLTILREGD